MQNTFTRKVRQSGNSKIITVPEQILKQLNAEKGDELKFEEIDGGVRISKYVKPKSINPKVIELANSIFEKNRAAFTQLVER